MSTPALVDLVCVLFEDTYGKTGARILRTLLDDGQQTLPELARHAKLPPSAVQRALVSMITNRFVTFWQGGPRTLYYGNWLQVYRILWSGQLLTQYAPELRDLAPITECLLKGLVPQTMANQYCIKKRYIVPVNEWQFWSPAELEQSTALRKARDIANNPESMGKSESAQKQQAVSETQAELERVRGQIFAERDNATVRDAEMLYSINWDKFLVQSRRHELVQFAAREIGMATAKIYEILLRLSEYNINSVRDRRAPSLEMAVTTQQIVSQLDEKLLKELASALEISLGTSAGSSGSETAAADLESQNGGTKKRKNSAGNQVSVQKLRPAELVNQHLDLLVESRAATFVQKLGSRLGGEWFVPFDKVNLELKQQLFNDIVSQSFGEPASRLLGFIRARGKLDEKMLGNFALLPASEIRHQMSVLSCYGFADIQELSNPNQRSGSGAAAAAAQKRSVYLWYHRPEWAYARLLDLLYVQITDAIRATQKMRTEHQTLLTKLCREDVKSAINQFLTTAEREELKEFRENECELYKKINMLDRHVRVFREY